MKRENKPELKVEIIGSAEEALNSLSESEKDIFFSTLLKRVKELHEENQKEDNKE